MKNNKEKMAKLRAVQVAALQDDSKPKIKILERIQGDDDKVSKNLRGINQCNRDIHSEI